MVVVLLHITVPIPFTNHAYQSWLKPKSNGTVFCSGRPSIALAVCRCVPTIQNGVTNCGLISKRPKRALRFRRFRRRSQVPASIRHDYPGKCEPNAGRMTRLSMGTTTTASTEAKQIPLLMDSERPKLHRLYHLLSRGRSALDITNIGQSRYVGCSYS